MSCTSRSIPYRRCTRCTGTDEGRLVSWSKRVHPSDAIDIPVVPYGHEDGSTVPPSHWTVIQYLLHTSDPTNRRQAVQSIFHLIESHGRLQIPSLTDADIRALWTSILDMIPPQSRARLPSPNIPESLWRDMLTLLFIHASESTRSWLWERFRSSQIKSGGSTETVVLVAMRWGIPMWVFPNGIALVHDAIRIDPLSGFVALTGMIRFWAQDPDLARSDTLHSLLAVGVSTAVQVYDPVSDTDDRRSLVWLSHIAWIAENQNLLRLNPSFFHTIPGLAESIFAFCTVYPSEDSTIAKQAFTILESIRPFDHPLFRSTLDTVLRTVTTTERCIRATTLLMDSYRRAADLPMIHSMIEWARNLLTDPDAPMAHTTWAITVFRFMMTWEDFAPAVIPIVRTIIHHPNTPYVIVAGLAETPYAASITGSMIDLAVHTLGTRYPHLATTILSAAWGKGYDAYLIHTIHTERHSTLVSVDLIEVLQHGLYSSHVGTDVVDLINDIAHDRATSCILSGISKHHCPGRPIPPAILPMIIHACHESPQDVTPRLLDAIWDTSPHSAVSVIRSLLRHDADNKRWVLAIRSLRNGWRIEHGEIISSILSLLESAVLHYVTMDNHAMDHSVTTTLVSEIADTILDGVANRMSITDRGTVLRIWYHMLQQGSLWHLRTMASCVHRRVDIWERGDPAVAIEMVEALYAQCIARNDADTMLTGTTGILENLTYGWGRGVDSRILGLVDVIVHQITQGPPSDPYTMTIVIHLVRLLRYGWGRGFDRTIGSYLNTILTWFHRTFPRWYKTSLGPPMMLALTAGGGDPSRSTMPIPTKVHSSPAAQVQTMLKQWLTHDNGSERANA